MIYIYISPRPWMGYYYHHLFMGWGPGATPRILVHWPMVRFSQSLKDRVVWPLPNGRNDDPLSSGTIRLVGQGRTSHNISYHGWFVKQREGFSTTCSDDTLQGTHISHLGKRKNHPARFFAKNRTCFVPCKISWPIWKMLVKMGILPK